MTMTHILRFLPAILVLPVWLTIALREDLFVASFQQYYPLSLAMVFGSMIAGSTPLGGGVVAFPVSVLIIGFTPSQGRDFSLMIQSCGMTAASFLILVTRLNLLKDYGSLLAKTICFNVLGLIAGAFVDIPPFIAMCTYTTSIASFALILAYVEVCLQKREREPSHTVQETERVNSSANLTQMTVRSGIEIAHCTTVSITGESVSDENIEHHNSSQTLGLNLAVIAVFSFVGGFMSYQIGTGADMTWYAYGSLIHNSREGSNKIGDNDLTAISIIVMTVTSIFGTILRVSTSGDGAPTAEAYHAFIACACIVILGAPVGALFLSANHRRRLKGLFYILAILQLAIFGIIKIRDNVVAWCAVGGSLGMVIAGIAAADWFVFGTAMRGWQQSVNNKS